MNICYENNTKSWQNPAQQFHMTNDLADVAFYRPKPFKFPVTRSDMLRILQEFCQLVSKNNRKNYRNATL